MDVGSTDRMLETVTVMLWVDVTFRVPLDISAPGSGLSSLQRGSLCRDHDPGVHVLDERNWRKGEK